ncbi:MAG: response regulator transcription factor [Acidimicrobiales bacterium]
MRVLLVEDDESIAQSLVAGLERERFEVQWVTTGTAALAVDDSQLDLVLLDLGLPDVDGLDVCRELRARSDVPIIVLTARDTETDRVVGLELGADDYLGKPFGFRELLARIRAVLRRRAPAEATAPVEVLTSEAIRVDVRTHEVRVHDEPVELTPKEFDLLVHLMSDPGAVQPRQRILEEVWDRNWFGPTKTLDVHVASLRRKLGDPGLIETVRGIGFRVRPARP